MVKADPPRTNWLLVASVLSINIIGWWTVLSRASCTASAMTSTSRLVNTQNTQVQPQVNGAAPSVPQTCFNQSDYNAMFTARVSQPDPQLKAILEITKPIQHYPTFSELLKTFYHKDENIYAGFTQPTDLPPFQYSGRTSEHTLNYLRHLHPGPVKFMLEVGSFIGGSAERFGKFLEHQGVLMCVDTWNGDINMILLEHFEPGMARNSYGNPRIYERFLQRMVENNLTTTVLPLRASSITGARLVHSMQYTVDVIYLDSAHEYGETFFELTLFWEVLKPGGVLMGDDYGYFPAVRHDVDLFVRMKGLKLLFDPNQGDVTWYLHKPL